MKLLRWFAVIPVSILAWYVALLAGMAVALTLDVFCPADKMVSGLCTAWWHRYAMDATVVLFAGIAAFLIVISATLMAPSHKLQVAWAAFVSGLAFAVYGLVYTAAFGAFIACVVSGVFAIFCVARHLGVGMLPTKLLTRERSIS